MIFHSLDFLIFFAAFILIYRVLGRTLQNVLLLVGSYLFYGYIHTWFLYLIVFSTLVDYFCGLGMAGNTKGIFLISNMIGSVEKRVRPEHRRKLFLMISLTANLGVLCFFKYLGFFVENVNAILNQFGLETFTYAMHIVLPVGISFYTFQTLSYTIDIYRGQFQPTRNLLSFAGYVSFFPQLVAGPIERAARLLPQFEKERHVTGEAALRAVHLIIWGFVKKLVIADNVSLYADKVFALDNVSFFLLWSGVFAFCIQIYADFSAYSDIARGTARLLGFELVKNFDHPYLAKTPKEFWARWHISLSTWIRDYIYIPLGGSKGSVVRGMSVLVISFFLSGLWHGANWNFIIWGIYHGLLIVLYRQARHLVPARIAENRLLLPFRIALMFFFANLGWLIFREHDLGYLIRHLSLNPLDASLDDNLIAAYFFLTVCVYSLPLWLHAAYSTLVRRASLQTRRKIQYGKWVASLFGFWLILLFRSRESGDFIYFQF